MWDNNENEVECRGGTVLCKESCVLKDEAALKNIGFCRFPCKLSHKNGV